MPAHTPFIADALGLRPGQVDAVTALLKEGATVPFIARYRKEATGSLDEVAVGDIRDRLEKLAELDKRREAILSSLEERGLLTDALRKAVESAPTIGELEDIYLPHRPKRRTRGAMARERGLEPLARIIMRQGDADLAAEVRKFVSPSEDKEKDVPGIEAALAGARDIIAEGLSEDARTRQTVRGLFRKAAAVSSKPARGKKDEAADKFRDYLEWSEPARKAPGHRILAMLRGEAEGLLSLSFRPPEDEALRMLERSFVRSRGATGEQMRLAVDDGYKRLLAPSLENELRTELKQRADAEAIAVFASNLRQLLLAAPLGRKRVLALDPGYRTGAKLVCLDEQGNLIHHDTVYPTQSAAQAERAAETVRQLADKYAIQAVAVGNGTAGRETESFVRGLGLDAEVVLVDEAGASIYSASEIAREEFPDLDLTVRGAASIGRRLMDPLAELVKLDPKSIGVGQYQHDVDQTALRKTLDDVVASCVNAVGVELNTASKQLLANVSGLGPVLAGNIVAHRAEHGPFASRRELLKVARLGPKAFEQCAGFLRISGAKNPLDASAVHPERYKVVERMAADLGTSVQALIQDSGLRASVDPAAYVDGEVGLPTLRDILAELEKPGRDPRERFEAFRFADVHAVGDLEPGMVLPGIVTNVTKFGAFVDVGVKQDGLVHVSHLADRFVRDPAEVVAVRQQVLVRVLKVDAQRKRISLSMKDAD